MHATPALFFIGIGGIGMSAIARYFLHQGVKVGGYDRVRTPLTITLEQLGAEILYTDAPNLIPQHYRTPNTLVVYTPAIPQQHPIRRFYEQLGCTLHKRSQVLGWITQNTQALCVAGTHGKTTTSTLLAHLLYQSHIGTSAFLGGVSLNYNSNLLLNSNSPYVVIEADEYDRSFHTLSPQMAIITSTAPDHLDIYGTPQAFQQAFQHFASLVDPKGLILLHEEAELSSQGIPATIARYGESASCSYRYENIVYRNGELYFNWVSPTERIEELSLGSPLEINVLNATAAIAVARNIGVTPEEIRAALASFKGAHRRFERVLNQPGLPVLLDDYAHHPDEIQASLASIRKLYPNRSILVVFQPHLYSRTRDFYIQFGEALSAANQVLLLPIYPAREEPMPGVQSEMILPYISTPNKAVCSKQELLGQIARHNPDVVVMMGAGDIEFEVPKVYDLLKKQAYHEA